MRNSALVIVMLGLLAAIIYWRVGEFNFVDYDDPAYVSQNSHVQAGFTGEGVRYAFTTHDVGNWNPLVWLSYYADRTMFDLKPGAMHLENVALHLIASILLFLVLKDGTDAIWRSAIVAALFLCDPMHVESVAWISERKDVLSVPLLFAAIGAYFKFARARLLIHRRLFYVATLLFFVMSLMAKPMGITLPLLLLLLDVWPLGRFEGVASLWGLVVEKVPLIIVSVAAVVSAILAQQATGATSSLTDLSSLERFANAILACANYSVKLIVPINLAVFYPYPATIPLLQVAAASILMLVITAGAIRARSRMPYVLVGWFWFLIALIPVLGLIQIGSQSMADRYSYLPSVGLFIAIVWPLAQFPKQVVKSWVIAVLAALVIAVFVILSRRQMGYWQDTETLFTHAAAVTSDNWVADLQLGNIAFARDDFETATGCYSEVIRLQPKRSKGYFNLGTCWMHIDPNHATPLFEKAVSLEPESPEYRLNLAASLASTGRRDEAIEQCKIAIALRPGYIAAENAMADLKSRATTRRDGTP